ncbi:carbohydrate kinase family protein [Faecalicatena contorta]|uniref:carbohydrate kinase family protein n=1 Tax=Faecalicatena contorta TaxID=39482 RepID=UPI001F2A9F30|nr:PfkB family carbohydrate kinase [Faecalicatena contorta]MCF2555398.1 kinase [Faecalicatena contorta]MCF2679867.1 kinase [Faecalicatena contorta]
MKKREPEIMIIGAAILDVLVRPASERVFETGSYPAQDIHMSTGADALNEATVLAALGDAVRLETVLGNDDAGKHILSHCREAGIQVEEKCIRENLATGINVVLVKEDGSRCFLTNANGSLRALTVNDVCMPFPDSVKMICFASIFVFPHIGAKELECIFTEAKQEGKIVCADMTRCKNGESVSDMRDAFANVDYLFQNDEEAMLLTRTDTVEEAAKALRGTGAGHVIVKCGARGCYVATEEEDYWVPVRECVRCIDTTGAGDSFVAGFLHALLKKKDVRFCAEYANLCGGKAVEHTGATEWIKD